MGDIKYTKKDGSSWIVLGLVSNLQCMMRNQAGLLGEVLSVRACAARTWICSV